MKNKENILKEIEDLNKDIRKKCKEDGCSFIPTFEEANELRLLESKFEGYKLCEKEKDEKFKKFIEKLKDKIFERKIWTSFEINDKLNATAKEEFGGLI